MDALSGPFFAVRDEVEADIAGPSSELATLDEEALARPFVTLEVRDGRIRRDKKAIVEQ